MISTLLSALGSYINAYMPFGNLILQTRTFLLSFGLIALLFGAIYKVVPDRKIEWRDVMTRAVVTAFLFTVGKSLISLYIGSSTIASSYGAAGSLIVCTFMDLLLGTNLPTRGRIHEKSTPVTVVVIELASVTCSGKEANPSGLRHRMKNRSPEHARKAPTLGPVDKRRAVCD